MNKIKKGDQVVVIAGKDKGKKGKVTQVMAGKVLVEGVNLVKKHVKANPNADIRGGIELKSMPLHISNVCLYDEASQCRSRVAIKRLEDGTRVRYFKSSNQLIDAKV